MNKKDYLANQFNLCLSSDYNESPVDISESDIDILLNKKHALNIQKTRINKETTLLTIGFPFKR